MEKVRSFGHNPEGNAIELVKAQTHIWNTLFSFVNIMSLKCAIQLGIPNIIHTHGKPMTLSQLVASLPTHQSKSHNGYIYRLMHILVYSSFFALQEVVVDGDTDQLEEGYVLTNSSKLLLKDNPALGVAPFLLAMLDPIMTEPWHSFSTWLQNDDPTPFAIAHKMEFWDYCKYDSRFGCLFNDSMASDTCLVTSVVIDKCKSVFEGLESLVDLGGGPGTVAKAITDAFPSVECTVFDLPHVIANMKGSKNLRFVGGNMFEEKIPPADAIFMKSKLHGWGDEDCVNLLKRCKEVITSNGNKKGNKVIIVEMVVEEQKTAYDHHDYETQLFSDMLFMVWLPGRERQEKEWAKLFSDAGFSNYKITPILGRKRSLIELFP